MNDDRIFTHRGAHNTRRVRVIMSISSGRRSIVTRSRFVLKWERSQTIEIITRFHITYVAANTS